MGFNAVTRDVQTYMKLQHFGSEKSSTNAEERHRPITDQRSSYGEPPIRVGAYQQVRQALSVYLLCILSFNLIPVLAVSALSLTRNSSPSTGSLLFGPAGPFTDFTDFSRRIAHFGESDMLTRQDIPIRFPYPLTTVYAFLFFVRTFPNPLAAYLVFVIATFTIATVVFSLTIHRLTPDLLAQVAIWTTLLSSFPLVFLIERGNIEAFVWLLIVLGLWAYTRNRFNTAAILLSVAACMKIFPATLLCLFLAKRKYRAFSLALAATVLISVLSLYGVGPTILKALSDYSEGAAYLQRYFINAPPVPRIDHSAFGIFKLLIYVREQYFGHQGDFARQIGPAFTAYNCILCFGVTALYFLRIKKLPILNQLISCLVLCTLLPYVSYEYTLVYVFIIWSALLFFLLSDVARGHVSVPQRTIYLIMISCVLVFAPLTYFHLPGGAIKTVCLVAILVAALSTPMPSSLFQELSEDQLVTRTR